MQGSGYHMDYNDELPTTSLNFLRFMQGSGYHMDYNNELTATSLNY